MAYNTWSLNNTPANGGAAIFLLKTMLKAAWWTVKSSSDGTTYNSSGDQITTNTTGAGGILNANAWFRIAHPTYVGKELCFQANATPATAAANWRIKSTANSGFTGGSPGATQTPAGGTDQKVLVGAGTDASPTFAAAFGTDGGYRFNCASDSTTGAFWSAAWPSGGGSSSHGLCLEKLTPSNVSDTDPWLFGFGQSAFWEGFAGKFWGSYNNLFTVTVDNFTIVTMPASFTTDPFNGKNQSVLNLYYLASNAWKGSGLYLNANNTTASTTPALNTNAAAGDTLVIGASCIPWQTGTAITV